MITLAGFLDAVVLEDSLHSPQGATLLRDIDTKWFQWSELRSTQRMFDNCAQHTTGASKTNLGWDTKSLDQLTVPNMSKGTATRLFDYVVVRKLFNFFLLLGCVPLTSEHDLANDMATSNPWQKSATLYGCDNTTSLAGSIYEAETMCASTHNWSQVASDGASNMAFSVHRRTTPRRRTSLSSLEMATTWVT